MHLRAKGWKVQSNQLLLQRYKVKQIKFLESQLAIIRNKKRQQPYNNKYGSIKTTRLKKLKKLIKLKGGEQCLLNISSIERSLHPLLFLSCHFVQCVTGVQSALDSSDNDITDSKLRELKVLCLNYGRFRQDYSMTLLPAVALHLFLQALPNLSQTPLTEPVRQANFITPLFRQEEIPSQN